MTDTAVVTNPVGSTSPDASTNLGKAANQQGNLEVHSGTGGAGVIGITGGTVIINDSGAALLTLAVPVAGVPAAGGNDGQRLTIQSNTAHAHTVTTPASGINGAKHIVTFAAVGDSIELEAFGGGWLVVGTPTAVVS